MAEINQQTSSNSVLTPELIKFHQILKQIHEGKREFFPEEDDSLSLQSFNETVIYLREAKDRKYIFDAKEARGYGGIFNVIVIDGLTFKGLDIINNPEKLIIDNHPQVSIDMSTQNVNISGSTIHGSVLTAQKIENCLNTVQTSKVDNDIKQLLTELLNQIAELNSKVPAEKAQVIEEISRDAEDLVNEINSDNPRKRNSLFSLDGIKEAAENLGETAKPIIEIAEKISPLLLSLL